MQRFFNQADACLVKHGNAALELAQAENHTVVIFFSLHYKCLSFCLSHFLQHPLPAIMSISVLYHVIRNQVSAEDGNAHAGEPDEHTRCVDRWHVTERVPEARSAAAAQRHPPPHRLHRGRRRSQGHPCRYSYSVCPFLYGFLPQCA